MRMTSMTVVAATLALLLPVTTAAQVSLPGAASRALQGKRALDQLKDLQVTDKEEQEMGAAISARLREKYGVVQSQAVHKYVSLVGRTLAAESTRPGLSWTFIVLDTDGVNAFAAPGGFVHITRGALALVRSEAELAGVLAHEIVHVTEKHTLSAIRNSKAIDLGSDAALPRNTLLDKVTDAVYDSVLENKFDRGDEEQSDAVGVRLANKVGYAPNGLGGFLTKLADRNKSLKEPSGVFASHPATQARLQKLTQLISKEKLTAAATVTARYTATITYTPVPVTSVAQTTPGATAPAESKSGSKLGLGGLTSRLGGEKSGSQTVASAGARGVNPDRDAKGGSNPRAVGVTITAVELAAFRKGIAG